MSAFKIDFKEPTTWLLAPLLAPLLPFALLGGCSKNLAHVFMRVKANTARAIAAGDGHTCALFASGGVRCWGHNGEGQLGDGTTEDKTTPVEVSGLSSGVQAIAVGDAHTCALLQSGGVKCWGRNYSGELGNGTTTGERETTPVDVSGLSSGVQAIAGGAEHTCAILESGGMKCWGGNSAGQLGNGISGKGKYETTPVDVSGLSSDVQAIAAGGEHTCALLQSGGVKCWGRNYSGELGNGTTTGKRETTPVDVSGLSSGVKAIAAGGEHTCAVLQSGGMKCWGENGAGQLGNGISGKGKYETAPVDVSSLSSEVQTIAAGGGHTCALLQSGGVKCWGRNYSGELGNGTTTGKRETTPIDVSGLSSEVQTIAAGGEHTCAVLDSGDMKCWGDNEDGQLGNGNSGIDEYEATPVDVSGF